MELPSTLRQNRNPRGQSHRGFTLIEIMIVTAILVIILSLGLFISFDFYKSYAVHSEKNIIVSVLQKARSQSLNNINQVRHGVHFTGSPMQYIIFECQSFVPNCTSYASADTSKDNPIESAYAILITSPALPFNVVFDQLSGASLDKTITVSDGTKSYNVTINSEGRIDWQ